MLFFAIGAVASSALNLASIAANGYATLHYLESRPADQVNQQHIEQQQHQVDELEEEYQNDLEHLKERQYIQHLRQKEIQRLLDQYHDEVIPIGWELKFDQRIGRKYYANHIDKTTHWNLPDNVRRLIQVQRQRYLDALFEEELLEEEFIRRELQLREEIRLHSFI